MRKCCSELMNECIENAFQISIERSLEPDTFLNDNRSPSRYQINIKHMVRGSLLFMHSKDACELLNLYSFSINHPSAFADKNVLFQEIKFI